ncbi:MULTISPECIES: mercuric transport protein MerTP [unclassified Imperialibacter]|uniref:mercuric transport protein MerTP n=1 Tax=unclassified Imperialibacter TaxID=2629706 RepID=UPI001255ADED|nr:MULTISPECIES: mercuric transport protein MerTP [unclassified Imperialibacter]CAD5264636.1 Copper chaperone CopZ [Imperialibacter sp. 89]CAD5269538.1 Copper chaperone CopZ [Imperialibacter sp. 75]VVT09156.1 Copper chaperone CopZ [Imperialibacter sp. EC-SDR9]
MSAAKSSKTAGIGLLAAITTSLCCITPVFSVLAGIGGIASTFSWMEPLRPYLIGLTVAVLAFAWYQKLKPRVQEQIGCACEEEEKPSFWQSKKFLGIVTLFAIVVMAFPSYSGIFFSDQPTSQIVVVKENDIKEAHLIVKGMTCTGCEHSVNHALTQSPGVLEATSSYETGIATVKFDQSKVNLEELAKAVEVETGYIVTNKQVINE